MLNSDIMKFATKKRIYMKLQISFDMTDLDQALSIAKKVNDYCDQLEVGSLMLFQFGTSAVEAFRKNFPDKTIVADIGIKN